MSEAMLCEILSPIQRASSLFCTIDTYGDIAIHVKKVSAQIQKLRAKKCIAFLQS